MADIQLESLSKTYAGGVPAVIDLTLSIGDGEFVVLVGPSGCGKTTTLRLIAGLEEPTSGTVRIGGRVVNGVHPRERDIAMVFQNYALYPHMTAYKNMAFALKLRRMPRAEIDRRVRETARLLEIEALLARRPRELSGGQRQRVALGRAIVREPRAFLFDEPLSNLDARLRVSTRAELKALHQRLGVTTVHVTHDQEEAMTLGGRVAVMAGGRLLQADTPLGVYRNPANRFVASFIGMPPMNFLPGTLRGGGSAGGGLRFVEDRGEGGAGAGGDGAGWELALPAEVSARVGSHEGKAVVLGVRPQALGVVGEGTGAWRARVEVVEPLGDQVDVTVRSPAGRRLVARVGAQMEPRPGEVLALRADPARVHLFEPGEFGRAL